MRCHDCNNPDPSFHYKEVLDGEVVVVDLCHECAVKRGLIDSSNGKIDVPAVLQKLSLDLTVTSDSASSAGAAGNSLVCPECGVDERGIRESGRLGCPQCYCTFNELLAPALASMHRDTRHVGLSSATSDATAESSNQVRGLRLPQLEEDLARAVATEAYEKAAELRDLITKLKCD
jgi:protein arginine kinase activator